MCKFWLLFISGLSFVWSPTFAAGKGNSMTQDRPTELSWSLNLEKNKDDDLRRFFWKVGVTIGVVSAAALVLGSVAVLLASDEKDRKRNSNPQHNLPQRPREGSLEQEFANDRQDESIGHEFEGDTQGKSRERRVAKDTQDGWFRKRSPVSEFVIPRDKYGNKNYYDAHFKVREDW